MGEAQGQRGRSAIREMLWEAFLVPEKYYDDAVDAFQSFYKSVLAGSTSKPTEKGKMLNSGTELG